MDAGRKTVLVVDDEADARAFVETVVSEMGDFHILTAGDGESAVCMAKEELPDLVILDVTMPVKDGFQVFDELQRDGKTARIPIIMLTGVSADTGIRIEGKDMWEYFGHEPAAFLDKPVDPSLLRETIRKVLDLREVA